MISATHTSSRGGAGRALAAGAVAGVLASLVMAMYAMVAAWADGTGFFTPLHHIASLWASPDAMMASMQAAMDGSDFRVTAGAAVLGAAIHLMTGAVFGLIISRLHPRSGRLLAAGLAYGGPGDLRGGAPALRPGAGSTPHPHPPA